MTMPLPRSALQPSPTGHIEGAAKKHGPPLGAGALHSEVAPPAPTSTTAQDRPSRHSEGASSALLTSEDRVEGGAGPWRHRPRAHTDGPGDAAGRPSVARFAQPSGRRAGGVLAVEASLAPVRALARRTLGSPQRADPWAHDVQTTVGISDALDGLFTSLARRRGALERLQTGGAGKAREGVATGGFQLCDAIGHRSSVVDRSPRVEGLLPGHEGVVREPPADLSGTVEPWIEESDQPAETLVELGTDAIRVRVPDLGDGQDLTVPATTTSQPEGKCPSRQPTVTHYASPHSARPLRRSYLRTASSTQHRELASGLGRNRLDAAGDTRSPDESPS